MALQRILLPLLLLAGQPSSSLKKSPSPLQNLLRTRCAGLETNEYSAGGGSDTAPVRKSAISVNREISKGGFFRTFTSTTFEMDDILSTSDMAETWLRFSSLLELFPDVDEVYLRDTVSRLPLYLAIETEKFSYAVERMRKELPFVDPSYVLQQRAAGLDLFLSFMGGRLDDDGSKSSGSHEFNVSQHVEELEAFLIHKGYQGTDTMEFVRRVPHAVTSRYLLALQDFCVVIEDALGLSAADAMAIVEKWPAILTVDVAVGLRRLQTSLARLLQSEAGGGRGGGPDVHLLATIVKTVPRVLVQDPSRRLKLLAETYPRWDLISILRQHPRVLTEKAVTLDARYGGLLAQFADVEGSPALVDAFINKYPIALLRNAVNLRKSMDAALEALPSCRIEDILDRGHGIVTINEERLAQQVGKLQAVFSRVRVRVSEGRGKGNGVAEAKPPPTPQPAAAAAEPALKASPHIVELARQLAQQFNDEEDIAAAMHRQPDMYLADDSLLDEAVTWRAMDYPPAHGGPAVPVEEGRLLFMQDVLGKDTSVFVPSELSMLADPIPAPTAEGAAAANSAADSSSSSSTLPESRGRERDKQQFGASIQQLYEGDDCVRLDLTRLVMGNVAAFTDGFPLLLQRVQSWVDEFGPEIAYSVLTAVPKAVTKKPSQSRPLLKHLYALVADTLVLEAFSDGSAAAAAGLEAEASGMQLGHICRGLHLFLRYSPGTLRLSLQELEERQLQLQQLLGVSPYLARKVLARAPMLASDKLDKVRQRSWLLSLIVDKLRSGVEGLIRVDMGEGEDGEAWKLLLVLSHAPLLTLPTSKLYRVLFALSLRSDTGARVVIARSDMFDRLLLCDTDAFVEALALLLRGCGGRGLSERYGRYLAASTAALGGQGSGGEQALVESEKRLCGLLNERALRGEHRVQTADL